MKIGHLSVLATVVVAFAASTALILNGQSELRRDMWAGQAEIRKDMRAGQAELREGMRTGQAELRAGQAGIRKEMQAIQAELRQEMKAGQIELRKDLRAVEAELRAGQAGIREDLKSLEVRIAVVEQRTAAQSGEPGAFAVEPAPAASPDGRHHSARASLLLARALTAPFGSPAADAPQL